MPKMSLTRCDDLALCSFSIWRTTIYKFYTDDSNIKKGDSKNTVVQSF